jgi:hypothetical protein
MQNPATIVVSLQEGQEELNIVRRAAGLGNHQGVINGTIAVGGADDVILNSDHRYQ